jgi:translation elongation factor P/translation initiation factor 5A
MVEYKFIPVNSVKEGNVIDIEGYSCKVISIEKSKPENMVLQKQELWV